jgi:hypothetical protein
MSKNQAYQQQRERWDLILVRLPPAEGKIIREIARKQAVSTAQIIREAVKLYIEG